MRHLLIIAVSRFSCTLLQLHSEFQVFFSTHYVLIVWRLEFKFRGINGDEIAVASDWLPKLNEGIRKVYALMKADFFFSVQLKLNSQCKKEEM